MDAGSNWGGAGSNCYIGDVVNPNAYQVFGPEWVQLEYSV